MDTYICFNDESGSLEDENRTFYVRASLVINASDLKKIEQKVKDIKNKMNLLNLNVEIKWHDLWQIRQCFKKNTKPKDNRLNKIYQYLISIRKNYHLLIDYCENSLSILNEMDCKIILTFTQTNKYKTHNHKDIYKFHIQDHLQRLQMEYQKENAIILVIYDSIDKKKRSMFKEIYNEIITNGDFIKNYSVVYDSLLFDDSHCNALLQITDFIAGLFANLLVAVSKNDSNNYQKAVEFYFKFIEPKIPQKDSNIWGIGLMEVPTEKKIRNYYRSKINDLKNISYKSKLQADTKIS